SADEWSRGQALQLALEGYITVVPDLLSGMAPNGGDSDSFASPEAIRAALDHMDRAEIDRRLRAARDYASSLPAASGQTASVELDRANSRLAANVDAPLAGVHSASFGLSAESWPKAMTFLAVQTNNHPIAGTNANEPVDHTAHMAAMAHMHTPGMVMAQDAG